MALAVGLMSGTSIDGVDVALVEIQGKSPHLKIQLRQWQIIPFPKKLREDILALSRPGFSTTAELCRLHFQLGELFAQSVLSFLKKARVPLSSIDVIGSHGQTVAHLGRAGTLQIGEASIIAERTGITTVADFRPRDIACGGFGAPLAPYFHALFFRHPQKHRAIHNIGGISNLTMVPRGGHIKDVFGFDTGPGNMVIDGLLRETTRRAMQYDHGGKIAARGLVSLKLLSTLMKHPFIRQKPPKTSGREEFGRSFVLEILKKARTLKLTHEDTVATVTALTAVSIAENYRRFVFPKNIPDEIIFGGGGTHNRTLMKMIQAELDGIPVKMFDDFGLSSDAAEAACFAVLAYETLQGRPTNIPSVTGASHQAVLGKIIPGSI